MSDTIVTLTTEHKSLGTIWLPGTRGTVIATRESGGVISYLVDVGGRYPTWPDSKCETQ